MSSFMYTAFACKSKPSSNSITTTTTTGNFTDNNAKMATATPLAIGARGTIASLVRKEIDYFKRLDLDSSKRHQQEPRSSKGAIHGKPASNARTASLNNAIGYFFTMGWRKKKKRRRIDDEGGSFLPSMCSSVDVNEGNRFDRIPGFSYKSLKLDVEN